MLGEKMDKVVRRPRKGGYDVNELNGVEIGLNFDTLLVINVPDSRVLRVMSRSLFFVVFLLAVPSLFCILEASTGASPYENDGDSAKGFRILPPLLRDLVDEGLIKKGQKGFVLGAATGGIEENSEYLRSVGIDLLTGGDEKGNARQVFDFVFSTSFHGAQLIDGMLKDNGLIISQMGRDDSNGLSLLTSYKIVYLRRFENIMVAMRKTGTSSSSNSATDEVLCGARSEAKKAALEGLEEVYLEPPPLEKKPSFTSRKIKFLPDLMKDSLDHYPRRVFISDDSGALDWFSNNYPMRNHEFEVYNAEVTAKANIDGSSSQETSLSSWLTKNVKLEDYVVMKAEAQVVEEMLKDKSLCLVDELFLECKNQWEDGEKDRGSKRAYWQCLALYGKVRDEGIAVHQWWK